MGLREVFKKAGQTIVKAFGNVAVEVTYTVYGDKTYDDETGVVTTPSTEYPNIKMFFGSYTTSEQAQGENVMGTDIKALAAVEDMTGIKPGPNDRILVTTSSDDTFRSGDVYKMVSDFKTDEAEAMYELHLRGIG